MLMVTGMKVILRMINERGKEYIIIVMVTGMKVIVRMINERERNILL